MHGNSAFSSSTTAVVASKKARVGTNAAYKFERSVFETGLIGRSNPSRLVMSQAFMGQLSPPLGLERVYMDDRDRFVP
jgi:hypothetical protein